MKASEIWFRQTTGRLSDSRSRAAAWRDEGLHVLRHVIETNSKIVLWDRRAWRDSRAEPKEHVVHCSPFYAIMQLRV